MLPTKPPSCQACPAYAVGLGYVPSSGPPRASLAIIGQGPGEQEVAARRPFVGPSGNMLSYWIRKAGLSRSEIHIDNIVRCRLVLTDKQGRPVLKNGKMQNRPPTAAETAYCWPTHGLPTLRSALADADPAVVIPCGVPATKVFLGRHATASLVGTVHEINLPELP